jgi:hypothetical protein
MSWMRLLGHLDAEGDRQMKSRPVKKHLSSPVQQDEIMERHSKATASKGFIKTGIVVHEGKPCTWFVKPGKNRQEQYASLID